MKKIVIAIAFAMISFLGFAQENETVYFDAVTNIRIGYAGVVNTSEENLQGGVDFGFNLIEFGVRPYATGAISLGVDFNLDSFHAADGYYFLTASHKTAIVPALNVFREVKRSRLEVINFGMPLNFTQTIGGKLAVTVGATAKINLDSDTFVSYLSATEDYNSLYTSGVKTQRFGYDIHLAVTYDDFGIYASYSPMKVFANGAGPGFNFFSVGVFFRNPEN